MLQILLGKDGGGNVYWTPKKEKNPHFMVVGTSGSGKTETLKAIVHELNTARVPSLIIDFHQDFEDVAESILDFSNVTINPLEYGAETPETVMYKVSHILKKIFHLGVQQEGVLQNAIQRAYEQNDIDIRSREQKKTPTFDDVKSVLENMLEEEDSPAHTIDTLLVRLRPLFNTGFFAEKKAVPFSQIFGKTTVLKLKNMPTEEVKYAIAEFFINKLKYELYSRGKTDKLVLYCIIDEAHRLIDERSPLNDLLRESRKYGTGVILSSQRPSDFSEIVLANVGGILALQCRLDKDAMFVARQIGVDFELIRGLTETGSGYVNFSSEKGTKKIKVTPIWDRTKEKQKPKEERRIEKKIAEEPVTGRQAAKIAEKHAAPFRVAAMNEKTPPHLWLLNGFRKLFPDPKIGAVFTIAAVALLPVIGYAYWFAFLIAFMALLVLIGMRK